MSFFKKIGKSISSAFKKAPSVVQSIFKKGSDIAGQVAGGLGKVGDVLGKVGSVASTILNNPLAEGAASMLLGPEAGAGMALAGRGIAALNKGAQLAKAGSSLAGRVSTITNPNQYKTVGDVVGGIQKAKALGQDILGNAKSIPMSNGVAGPTFV